jgi:hypothetical protein
MKQEDKHSKEVKHTITGESNLFPGVRLTINPKLNNVNPEGNPKKMAEAKRILSTAKRPFPWEDNNTSQ